MASTEFLTWLMDYGSFGLFFLLAMGIIGLPIPDETLLVLAGFLTAKGHLSAVTVIPAAFLGAMTGITTSYVLGYLAGKSLLRNHGHRFGLTEKKLDHVHSWFEHWGKWLLIFGYYVPGVRHLTGFIVGAAYVTYWQFALFAYIGALIWSMTFLSVGYFFHDAWIHLHHSFMG